MIKRYFIKIIIKIISDFRQDVGRTKFDQGNFNFEDFTNWLRINK